MRLQSIPADWRVATNRSMLGGAILRIAELSAELTPAARADRLREAAIPPEVWPEALERLAKLYEVWDGVEPGKGFDAKAAEWRKALGK